MSPTRITVVLDVDHEPEVDVPVRAARYLEETLSGVDGFGAVSVVRGEVDDTVWIPQGRRAEARGKRPPAPSPALFVRTARSRPPGYV
jgi:hypothetical protein